MLLEVKKKLEAVGFSFHTGPHNGRLPDGQIQTRGICNSWWYCWEGALGDWDIVNGPDCATEELAILSALDTVLDIVVEYAEKEADEAEEG